MNEMTFTGDELLLALVSLVRATRPGMLRQEGDGFTVDFAAIAASKNPRDSDRLLLKLGAAMQGSPPKATPDENEAAAGGQPANDGKEPGGNAGSDGVSLDIDAAEAGQIAGALAKLEQLQAWPEDVVAMSRALRVRLASQGESRSRP